MCRTKRGRHAPGKFTCPGCGDSFDNLETHYTQSRQCRPAQGGSSAQRDRETSFNTFATRLQSFLSTELWDAHSSRFVRVAHTEVIRVMIISVITFVLSFVVMELRAEAASPSGLTLDAVLQLCARITKVFQLMPTATAMVSETKRSHLAVEPRLRGIGDEEKKAVSFSLVQLIAVMLCESKAIRIGLEQ